MARQRKPDPVVISTKLQPLDHEDIIDFVSPLPRDLKSAYIRAALRIAKDNPELLKKYLNSPPEPPQISIYELLKSS